MKIEKEIKKSLEEVNKEIESSKIKDPSRRKAGLVVGGWVLVSVMVYNIYNKTKFVYKLDNFVNGFFYKTVKT